MARLMPRLKTRPMHRLRLPVWGASRTIALALWGVAWGMAALGCGPAREHVAFVDGHVITIDERNPVAEAFGIVGDRIERVGDSQALRAWAAETGAEVVSLGGRTVLPGFVDAHGHFPGEGLSEGFLDLNSPPIGDVSDLDDLVSRVAARADETAAGDWVVGFGFDDSLVEEKRMPNRDDLDRATQRHPVAVLHISGHAAVVNSMALERLGIDAGTPDPEGGVIRKRPGSNEPDGLLEETAMDDVQELLLPGPLETLQMFRAASERALAHGVTTAQNGLTDPLLFRALDWLTWLGVVPLRIVVWPNTEAADALLAGDLKRSEWDPLRMRVGAVKLIADGSIQAYTGYLALPYHVPPGDDPGFRGYPRIPRDVLFEQVERYHRAGLQIAIHGNGDASIDDILDAIEHAQYVDPRKDTRHVVIHAQMARPDQLDRMQILGVIPSFFSLHTFYWGDRHRTIFMGPERAAGMSPARSAQLRGLPFTIHCDAPVVPMEPLRLVWSAVNRRTRSGFVVGPEERIDVMPALRAVTLDAAHQQFEEADKGSIEVGKLADFVVLSDDPLSRPETIDEIVVLETWIGGEQAYVRDAHP